MLLRPSLTRYCYYTFKNFTGYRNFLLLGVFNHCMQANYSNVTKKLHKISQSLEMSKFWHKLGHSDLTFYHEKEKFLFKNLYTLSVSSRIFYLSTKFYPQMKHHVKKRQEISQIRLFAVHFEEFSNRNLYICLQKSLLDNAFNHC